MKNAFFLLFVFFGACRKDSVTIDGTYRLSTSSDTLRFDTVFTATGSVTQSFRIFNRNSKTIRIASIRLHGGSASPFTINVNGQTGPFVEHLELQPNDSAHVFVALHINPTQTARPFLVQDSIAISYNGNKDIVQLQAYGQNARFLHRHTVKGNEEWNAGLPYVVLGPLLIAQGAHLTINEGCNIYLHADAPFVVEGRLTVHGGPWDSTKVRFTSDRLDEPYRGLPGAWPGIVFKPSSSNNTIKHAVISNAYQGIHVEPSPTADKLLLHETIIDNAWDAGLMAEGASVTAQNILISNCGKGLMLRQGGTYLVEHATVASYAIAQLPHNAPVLYVSNKGPNNTAADLNAVFRNCIFWGEGTGGFKEVVIEKNGTPTFNLLFDAVLWSSAEAAHASFSRPPLTQDPAFDSINVEGKRFDFHLKQTSPARNSGVASAVSLDLDGRPRPVGAPDLGAYEAQ